LGRPQDPRALPPGWPPPTGAVGWDQPAAWGTPPGAPDVAAFPVRLWFHESAGIGRLWGIPGIGVAVRALLVIPHIVALFLVGIVAGILAVFTWLPVLINGRQAGVVYTFLGGYLRWSTRLSSYVWLLTSGYPRFSLSDDPGERVRLEIDEDQRVNRFWGIPLIGFWLRSIILIPHYVALLFVGLAAAILLWFSWIPVLLLGRQSELVYSVVGGFLRWSLRVTSYLLLLHDRYPPFSLGNEEPDRYR
jgi:hypothetical protein